jgi:hypothetical protein
MGYSILVSRFSRNATASCVPSGLQSAATTFSRSFPHGPARKRHDAEGARFHSRFSEQTANSPFDETARTSALLDAEGPRLRAIEARGEDLSGSRPPRRRRR